MRLQFYPSVSPIYPPSANMAETLYCEEARCERPASVFGFLGRKKKLRTCESHSLTLIHKKATLYDISAFSFLRTAEDEPLYRQRRDLMRKGMSNLTLIEATSKKDWEVSKQRLQESCKAAHAVVDQSFQEMQYAGQHSYEALQKDVEEMRSHLVQMVLDREFQLSLQESAVCDSIPTGCLLHVAMGDCRLPVAETLLAHFHLLSWDMKCERQRDWAVKLQKCSQDQEAVGRTDVALELALCAKKLGTFGPSLKDAAFQVRANVAQRFQYLFTNRSGREAEECLEMGQNASRKGDFTEALSELKRGKNLLRGFDHLKLFLQLSNSIAEVYCQTGCWEAVVSQCQYSLKTWSRNPHNFELYRALYMLICALTRLERDLHRNSVLEEWLEKLISDNSHCQYVVLCIETHILQGKEEEEQRCQQACQFSQMPSFMGIECWRQLAAFNEAKHRVEEAKQAYLRACELFSVHFPYCLQYAWCLFKLGILYWNSGNFSQAESQLLLSTQLHSSHFPQVLTYYRCIAHLAVLYSTIKRPVEAEQMYQRVFQLSAQFAYYLNSSTCRSNLRRLYEESEVTVSRAGLL